jgi:hypothetical protein
MNFDELYAQLFDNQIKGETLSMKRMIDMIEIQEDPFGMIFQLLSFLKFGIFYGFCLIKKSIETIVKTKAFSCLCNLKSCFCTKGCYFQ